MAKENSRVSFTCTICGERKWFKNAAHDSFYDLANLADVCDDRSGAQHHARSCSALRSVAGDPPRAWKIGVGELGNSERECALFHAFGDQFGSGNCRVL